MLNMHDYCKALTAACDHYEKTAPTVRDHCDDLYIRINEAPEKVSLAELLGTAGVWNGGFQPANFAANMIYKLRYRLGMDTTGNAGY